MMAQHYPRMAALSSQAGNGDIGILTVHGIRLREWFMRLWWEVLRVREGESRSCEDKHGAESPQTLAGTPNRLCGYQPVESNILELAKSA